MTLDHGLLRGLDSKISEEVALRVSGRQLVTPAGQPVRLRGVGLGGWLSMENFITGYPSTEESQRHALRGVLGDAVYEAFFDRFYDAFFADDDAAYLASLGLNCVRIAVNYRHLEDDDRPRQLKKKDSAFLTASSISARDTGSTPSSTWTPRPAFRITAGTATTRRTSRSSGVIATSKTGW